MRGMKRVCLDIGIYHCLQCEAIKQGRDMQAFLLNDNEFPFLASEEIGSNSSQFCM